MNIAGIEYSFLTSGLDIYVSGCRGPHCRGCHNPETHDFSFGIIYDDHVKDAIGTKIDDFSGLIKNIFIFGGEPLDQKLEDLIDLLKFLKSFNRPVWLFTRYDLKDVSKSIFNYIDYIKCGRYIESLKTESNEYFGINLATSNQKLYKVSELSAEFIAA